MQRQRARAGDGVGRRAARGEGATLRRRHPQPADRLVAGRSSAERPRPVMWARPPDRPGPKGELPDLAIRDGRWKLLSARDGGRGELFDVIADPGERKNLATDHPEVKARLTAELIAWDKSFKE